MNVVALRRNKRWSQDALRGSLRPGSIQAAGSMRQSGLLRTLRSALGGPLFERSWFSGEPMVAPALKLDAAFDFLARSTSVQLTGFAGELHGHGARRRSPRRVRSWLRDGCLSAPAARGLPSYTDFGAA